MKCPFRPCTEVVKAGNRKGTAVHFPECYGHECPYYGQETHIGSITVPEYCKRTFPEEELVKFYDYVRSTSLDQE